MKRWGYFALVIAILMAGASVMAKMRPPRQSTAASITTAAADSTGDIDPDAIAALEKMGTYLRSLKAFQVEAAISQDDVEDDGERIQNDNRVNLLVRMPDRLRVEITNMDHHRLFFYDGKNFTIYAERVNYYATVPAPATIAKLGDDLDDKFGIELPLQDLFYWGTDRSNPSAIKGARDVGPAEVGGVTCEQYAFRQEGLDWQLWMQQGDYPLPRRLVITTLTDEARPQYSSVLTWNLAPSFNEEAFKFDPPKDAQKIVLAQAKADAK
jgi:hypothetical protein